MICTSIAGVGVEECISLAKKAELAEVRLDLIEGISASGAKRIFSSKKGLIAACRPGKMDEGKRKEILLAAMGAGAGYVDIEVDAPDAYKREIAAKAKAGKCLLIVSYHNYEKTPVRAELDQIVKWCFESGADIAKIACKANSQKDNARLLGLLDNEKKMIVVGMGEDGRLTRIVAPLLGSMFTFAAATKGKETAPGQMEKETLEKAMKGIMP
jgi:3-dehydroquinate dehydratase I